MIEYKKKVKFFMAGQEEAETSWLAQMSKDGYHLVNVNFGIQYVFKTGKPENYTYYIDMKEDSNMDEEYKLMYSDVGLEYVDTSNGYYYFRGEEGANTLAILNNEQGRTIGRLGVQKRLLAIVGIMNVIIFGGNFIHFAGTNNSYGWTQCINLACGLLCLGLAIKLQFKIKDMKASGVKEHYKSKMKDYSRFYTLAYVCVVLLILYSIISLFDLFMH
ncbi:MAG: DUF2812 domain-containing protein [Romboutsia sp.]|uniref:DUF2812 domain-containing protein n=1 Tax=Romboutsia sp. TaxID=1965302 RepID=UPI003F2B5F91